MPCRMAVATRFYVDAFARAASIATLGTADPHRTELNFWAARPHKHSFYCSQFLGLAVIGPEKIEAFLEPDGLDPSEAERIVADIAGAISSFEAKMNWMGGGPLSNPVARSRPRKGALHEKKKFNDIFVIALNLVERCSPEGDV